MSFPIIYMNLMGIARKSQAEETDEPIHLVSDDIPEPQPSKVLTLQECVEQMRTQ